MCLLDGGLIALINILGWLLAQLPTPLLRGGCCLLGFVFAVVLPTRRRAILSGLHFAYPGMPNAWNRKIFRENSARLIEMGLLVLVLPHLSERRLRAAVEMSQETHATFEGLIARGGTCPQLLLIPHLTLTELMVTLPLHSEKAESFSVGVLFRPLASAKLDRWLHRTRERFGVKLLSRKQGFGKANRILEERGVIGVLFDQKAGRTGGLMTFQDRVCSATELPGLLAKRHGARVFATALERTGFFQARLTLEEITFSEPAEIPIRAHQWLENWMAQKDERIADWLWAHQRWGSPHKPRGRFGLCSKRNLIELQNQLLNRVEIPRKTPIWVVLPPDAAGVRASSGLLERLRRGRPDWAFTVCGMHRNVLQLPNSGLAEQAVLLPESWFARVAFWWKTRSYYPEIILVLDPNPAAARPVLLSTAPLRIGFSPERFCQLSGLTTGLRRGNDFPKSPEALMKRWGRELEAFGLPPE